MQTLLYLFVIESVFEVVGNKHILDNPNVKSPAAPRDPRLGFAAPLSDYIAFYESLNIRAIPLLTKLAEDKIEFQDPYFAVTGYSALGEVLADRLRGKHRVRYKLLDYAWREGEAIADLRWRISVQKPLRSKAFAFDMRSIVHFSSRGRVMVHHDEWETSGGADFYGLRVRLELLWQGLKQTWMPNRL